MDQVTHSALIAAMQVVRATFSLGQKDHNVIIKEKRVIEKARGFSNNILIAFLQVCKVSNAKRMPEYLTATVFTVILYYCYSAHIQFW